MNTGLASAAGDSRLRLRNEAGGQAEPRVVNRADHSIGCVGVAGGPADRNIRGRTGLRAVGALDQIVDVDRGSAALVQTVSGLGVLAAARQVQKYIARAAAVRHHAAGVAQVGRRERRDVQLVDRRSFGRRIAGIDGGLFAEDRLVVIGRRGSDVIHFGENRLVLLVGCRILAGVEGAVRGFGSQRYGPVEQVRHLRQRAIGYCQQAHALTGVGLRLGQGHGVGLQAIDQRKAGGIVRAGVDLRSRRQLLQHGVQAVIGVVQVVFRVDS